MMGRLLSPLIVLLPCLVSAFTAPGLSRRRVERLAEWRHPNVFLKAQRKDAEENFDLQRIQIGDREFWAQQKELAAEMMQASDSSLKSEMREKFAQRRLLLVGDTAYIGFFIFCLLWIISENPFVALSYSVGALMGLAYAYGLGKYVETVGGSVDDVESSRGAGVGEARFAFLILLFVIVGRFRDSGLQEVPSIAGFFTYQLASLRQGLKTFND